MNACTHTNTGTCTDSNESLTHMKKNQGHQKEATLESYPTVNIQLKCYTH